MARSHTVSPGWKPEAALSCAMHRLSGRPESGTGCPALRLKIDAESGPPTTARILRSPCCRRWRRSLGSPQHCGFAGGDEADRVAGFARTQAGSKTWRRSPPVRRHAARDGQQGDQVGIRRMGGPPFRCPGCGAGGRARYWTLVSSLGNRRAISAQDGPTSAPSPSPSLTRLTHDGLQCGGVNGLLDDLKPLPLPQPVSARIGRR